MVLPLKIKVKPYPSSESTEKSASLSLEILCLEALISKFSYCSAATFSKHTICKLKLISRIAIFKLSYVLVTFTVKKVLEAELHSEKGLEVHAQDPASVPIMNCTKTTARA